MSPISRRTTHLITTAATVIVGLLSIGAQASTECSNLVGCERKFCEIETQLTVAREKGDYGKVDGLMTALEEASSHCTDEGLREDLIDEIAEAKEDIAEYEADLKEAEEEGDLGDLRKYQKKIEEETREIKMLEEELSTLE